MNPRSGKGRRDVALSQGCDNYVDGGYRGRKNPFQNYHTSSPSPQIANTNLNPSFPTKKPEPQTKHQRVHEQLPPLPLPLNEMYQKLLSIGHIAPEPLTPLQPLINT